MTLDERSVPARLVVALLVVFALNFGAKSTFANPPNGPQSTTAQSDILRADPGDSPGASAAKEKKCLCYGDKHDGPLKDLCVIKCSCPGECGKQGARRPAPTDSE